MAQEVVVNVKLTVPDLDTLRTLIQTRYQQLIQKRDDDAGSPNWEPTQQQMLQIEQLARIFSVQLPLR